MLPVFLVFSSSPTGDGSEVFNPGRIPASEPGVELCLSNCLRVSLPQTARLPTGTLPFWSLKHKHFTLRARAAWVPG